MSLLCNICGQHVLPVTSRILGGMLSDGKYQRPVLNPKHSIASFFIYSGLRMTVCPLKKTPNDPNETFTQWKTEKASSQLACITIPHHPSSFSQTYFLLLLLLIEWIFPWPYFDVGLRRTSYRVSLFWPVLFLCDFGKCTRQVWLSLLFCLCVLKRGLFSMCHSQKSSIHAWSRCVVVV